MKEIMKYSNCFICGDKNDCGVKAEFFYDGEKAVCQVNADEKFEGYKGIYHGGVIASLLDEIMIKAVLAVDKFVVTAEMTVKYLKPVEVGDVIYFEGKVISHRGRIYLTEGYARNSEGEIYAGATGKYFEASAELKDQLMKSNE